MKIILSIKLIKLFILKKYRIFVKSMKNILLLTFIMIQSFLFSQSLVQYTLASHNAFLYNPARAGVDKGNLFFHHKSQYIGISPINFSNQSLSFDIPLYNLKSGIGIVAHNDFSGFLANTAVIGNYAYHHKIKKSTISFGLGLGLHHLYLNGSKLKVASGDYEFNIVHNDKILDNETVSSIAFDMDFGINYGYKKLTIGVSGKNLLNHGNKIFKDNTINSSRNFIGHVSLDIDLISNLVYTPSLILKTDLVKYQTILSNNLRIKQNYYAGFALIGYNINNFDGFGIFLGAQLTKKIKAIYNFDIPLNSLKGANNGSHEILFQYRFDLKNKVTTKYFFNHNSRYL